MTARDKAPALAAGQKARVLIADKNPILRSGLLDIISRDGRFDVLGSVATGKDFLDAIAQWPVDIGVIGWSLTDMSGGDVLATVKRRQAPTRIVIYTGETASEVLKPSIRA